MWSVNSVAKPLRKRGLASTHTVYAFIHETRAVLARLSPGAGSRGNGNSSVCVAPNFALAHGPLFLLSTKRHVGSDCYYRRSTLLYA